MKYRIQLHLFGALSALVFVSVSTAATRLVKPSGSGPNIYNSLRAAYAAAQNGDTIIVDPTLFLESPGLFAPAKQVNIQAAGYKATVAANTFPANDNFANAISLSGNSVVAYGNNYAATTEVGEPSILTNQSRTVWWKWTGTAACGASIKTAGSDFPTSFAVFTGSSLGNLVLQSGGLISGEFSFSPGPGTTYYIAVGGQNANSFGHVTLAIDESDDGPNDMFVDRLLLTEAYAKVYPPYCSGGASKESGEPNHAGNTGGHSLWWQWTPPFSSRATIDVQSPTYDTLLAVYTGSSVSGLTLVTNNDDRAIGNRSSYVSFQAVAGTPYQIALDGKDLASGLAPLVFQQYPPLALTNFAMGTNIVCNGGGTTFIPASITVVNSGTAPSGPLRLRFVAEPKDGIQSEHVLGIFPVAPSILVPDQSTTFAINATLTNVPTSGAWEYVVVLEEEFSGAWQPKHVWIGLGYDLASCEPIQVGIVVSSGPVNLTPGVLGGQWAPVNLTNVSVRVPSVLPEGTNQQVSGLALFSNGSNQSFSNTTWSVSIFTITTNGLMQLGAVTSNTVLTITAPYIFGGVSNNVRTNITVVNLPAPSIQSIIMQPGSILRFTVHGVPNRQHRILSSTNLVTWSVVGTQACDSAGLIEFVNSSLGPNPQRFYRVQELP